MSITAVIPVRGGSRRVPLKNIKPFSGSSLLQIKIEQLKRINSIDEIIVSSDSDEMLELANKMGVISKHRPTEYCDEKSRTFNDLVEYIMRNDINTETVIWAPCVCPLVRDESFLNAISIYNQIKNNQIEGDSVLSTIAYKQYLFDETGRPINYTIENHVPSQKLPHYHQSVNAFHIASKENMLKWRFVYGPKVYLYDISQEEGIDIDTQTDFDFAEFLYKRKLQKY